MLLPLVVIVPLLLAVLGWHYDAPFMPGAGSPTVSDNWATLGTLLSYFGLVFSSYAAFEVNRLSKRYFAKARLPAIQGEIAKITERMSAAAAKTGGELRSERFIPKISVFLRSIGRIKGHQMKTLIQTAQNNYSSLERWMNDPINTDRRANSENSYWNLFRSLHELSEEIDTFLKEQEAK